MMVNTMSSNENVNKKIIQWACDTLLLQGYALRNKIPENVQNTPWSYVIRLVTFEGYVYLKHTPPLLALEANINQILYEHFHAAVPEVIARNNELNCFLMKDAGRPLREILKKKFEVELLCNAINQFTSMQLAVVDHINIFLDIGVPDWRLDKLNYLFEQLLSQKEILIADGLLEQEYTELENLFPRIAQLCKRLLDFSIQQTIVQCDFHDNNLLFKDKAHNLTIIDLGEIVISHPFFSLVGFLRQAKFHHSLKDDGNAYLQLKNTCFKNYLTFESERNLMDAFAIAEILWNIYEALAQYRLRLACDKEKFMRYQQHGKLSARLKEFIAACNDCD